MTPEQEKIIRRDYPSKGPTALAKVMGLSKDTIANWAAKLGIKFTGERHNRHGKWDDIDHDEVWRRAAKIRRENEARGDFR